MAQGPIIDADVLQKMDQYPNAYHPLILTIRLERQPLDLAKLLPTNEETNACTQAWQDWETLVERKKQGEEISDGEIKYFLEIAQRLDSAICEKQDTAYTAYRDDYNACVEQSVPKVVYELKQLLGKRVREPQVPSQLIGLKALKAELDQIVAIKGIQRVSYDLELGPFLDVSRVSIQADRVHNGEINGTPYTGAGVKIAVVDDGFYDAHDRLPEVITPNAHDWSGSGSALNFCTRDHGTQVGGVIFCQPGVDERTGIAHGATPVIAKVDGYYEMGQRCSPPPYQGETWSITQDAFFWAALQADGPHADVVNYSRGAILIGDDDTLASHFSSLYVDWVVHSSGASFVHACGNQPAAQRISPPSGAYNCLSVGNYYDHNTADRLLATINTTTSPGPTDEARRKPDLCAPGTLIWTTTKTGGFFEANGTSVAAPHVAGVCALLKEARPSFTPRQMKAVILNATDWMQSITQNGWDEYDDQTGEGGRAGWGMLNAYQAVLWRNNIWDDQLGLNEAKYYYFHPTSAGEWFVAACAWQRAMQGEGQEVPGSPGDIDIFLEGKLPGGQWITDPPLAQLATGDTDPNDEFDTYNNVEQVRFQQAPPGQPQYVFRLRVHRNDDHGQLPHQDFTLAARQPFLQIWP